MSRRSGRRRSAPLGVLVTVLLVAVGAGACSPAPLAAPTGGGSTSLALPAATRPDRAPSGTVTVAYPDEPSTFLAAGRPGGRRRRPVRPVGTAPAAAGPSGPASAGAGRATGRCGARPSTAGWCDCICVRARGRTERRSTVPTSPRRCWHERPAIRTGSGSSATSARPVTPWTSCLAGPTRPGPTCWSRRAPCCPASRSKPASRATRTGCPSAAAGSSSSSVILGCASCSPLVPIARWAPRPSSGSRSLFTPSYETALGLLEDGEVDVLLGYLALNGMARAEELDGRVGRRTARRHDRDAGRPPSGVLGGPPSRSGDGAWPRPSM